MKHSRLLIKCCLLLSTWILNAQDNDLNNVSLDSLLSSKISTASKYEQYTSEAPSSISVITKEDIEEYGHQTISQILNTVVGFYVSHDRNYDYLGLRGFSRPTDYNNRFLLLVDGFVMNDNIYNSVSLGTGFSVLSVDDIKQIEIVRGPGSALYGTNALFAVINIITKSVADIDGTRASVDVGSYGSKRARLSTGKKFKNGLELALSGNWADTEGQDLYFPEFDQPLNNNGIAEGINGDSYFGGNMRLAYKQLKFNVSLGSRTKDVPTASFETDFNTRTTTKDDVALVGLSYEKKLGVKSLITFKSFYNYGYYAGDYPYSNDYFFDKTIGSYGGVEGRYLHDFSESHRLIVGGEYQNHFQAFLKAWDSNDTYISENFPFQNYAFYIQDEFHFSKKLIFNGGLRYDKRSNLDGGLSARGALIYHPGRMTTIKGIYGLAFRNPNVYERDYFDGFYTEKNLDLKRETIQTIELVVEHQIGKNITGTLNVFNNKVDDIIELMELDNGFVQNQNISGVKASGVELELRAHALKKVNGYFNYAYQSSKSTILNKKLTNSPSHLVKAGVRFPISDFLKIGAEGFYESNRLTVYDTFNNPFLIANTNIIFTPFYKSSQKILNSSFLSFKVNNLFNTSYGLPGGIEHKQALITQNGRNFILRLNLNF